MLHRREYSESSLLVDFFTEETGRITLLARGARAKRSSLKGTLQPFTPLLLRWSGKGSLKILTKAEAASLALPLQQTVLYSGFYINELVVRLLENETAYPTLFQAYLHCLTNLARAENIESALRHFEFSLLKALGYGVDFCHCAGSGLPVEADMTYRYREEKGFIASMIVDNLTFYGRELLAFEAMRFDEPDILRAAKRFTRLALHPFLAGKPLKSRELFQQHLLLLRK